MLSELGAIWKVGIANAKLAKDFNPFDGTAPKIRKTGEKKRTSFTDAEVTLILSTARRETGCLRWLPWLFALTGARLGEICQSDAADVVEIDGRWCLRIHRDGPGRSLKNAMSRRAVPIHPDLEVEGFMRYARGLPEGSPLFPHVPVSARWNRRSDIAGDRHSDWLKKTCGLTDERIAPAHSWRHWFTDACRRVFVPLEVRSAITGHSNKPDESANYGNGMQTMTEVMADWLDRVRLPAGLGAPSADQAAQAHPVAASRVSGPA